MLNKFDNRFGLTWLSRRGKENGGTGKWIELDGIRQIDDTEGIVVGGENTSEGKGKKSGGGGGGRGGKIAALTIGATV